MTKDEKKEINTNDKRFGVIGAAIAWLAVVLQLLLMLQNRTESILETLIRFFSFFTILSNILVAICLTSVAARNSENQNFFSSPATLSAITVYILIVGLVYNFVLRSTWNPQGLQKLVDEVLHSVIPVYFFIYWVVYVPKEKLEWRLVSKWLLFPLAYLVYVLLRGSVSGFYPYPFVNAPVIGYTAVINNSLVLMGVFIFFSLLLIGLAKLLRKKEKSMP